MYLLGSKAKYKFPLFSPHSFSSSGLVLCRLIVEVSRLLFLHLCRLFLFFYRELGKEFVLDVLKLGFELLCDLVFVLIGVLWLGGSLGSLSSDLEILLSSKFTLKDLLHHFLLLGLESVIVQSTAQ